MRFGAGLAFTEMVSAHGIANESRKTVELLQLTQKERPAGIQIFGSSPEVMGNAAARCGEYPADLVDINAGCSVRKVLKTGAGAGMLGDPGRFYRVVKACVDASRYPVSVKMRLGLGEDSILALENALAAQDAGAALLTLHPRTAREGYSGRARWEYIALVKERLGIPVCGNGDIATPSDAVRMIRETGCDAVMIGRAAIGNPWLIRGAVRALSLYPEPAAAEEPPLAERVELALEHLRMIVMHKGEARGVREAKRHLHRYLRGMPRAARVRERILGLESISEAEEGLRDLTKAVNLP
jgi:nifR3 family TIM-barrel protein